jgi:fatty-acid desaturase
LNLFVFCLGYYLLASIVISVGYHRALSHRSLVLSGWLEKTMITLGLAAGTPVQWAGNHRYHHQHTDDLLDPHSPVRDGFWHAHCGWYIGTKKALPCFLYAVAGPLRTLFDAFWRPRTNQQYNYLAHDVQQDRYYAWLSKPGPYACIIMIHMGALISWMYAVWGWMGLIALYITYVLIYTIGDFTDSIAHMYGERPYQISHMARNNWVVGIFGAGEWHANHHTYPWSAKMGLMKGQFDLSWQFIRLCRKLKLASDIKAKESHSESDCTIHNQC